ncbi:hypothetical protein AB838_09765 [Rhodobacteraceae bacterium (ex Bugula neritina AB1)]|nr:hypothetical protein AB838_09765 [Rhodobacteraceae bacterium (ex Bugula neritina AB1)]
MQRQNKKRRRPGRRRGAAVLSNTGTKGGGDPVSQTRLLAGIGCGGIREEEDAAAEDRLF